MITPTIAPFSARNIGAGKNGGGFKITWASMTENDTAAAWNGGAMFHNKSAQTQGVTSGDTILIEGSNDETNYETLTDKQGGDMSFLNVDGMKTIEENARQIRPRIEAGTSVSVNIIIVAS